MANDIDEIYGTGSQVDFARQMARILMGQKGFQMSPGMAVLPGSWAYSVPDIVKQISGAQYRDIAGSQDKALRDRPTDPNAAANVKRYGGFAKPSAPHGSAHKAAMATGALPTTRSVRTMPVTPFKNMEEPETADIPADLETGPYGAANLGISDGMSTTVKPAIPDFETEVNPAPRTKGISSLPGDNDDISYPTQGNLEDELDKLVNSPAHKDKPAHVKQAAKEQFRRLAEEARGHFGRDVTVSEAIWYAQNKGTLTKNDLGAPPDRMNLGGPDAESIPPHLRADETKVAQSFNAPTAIESPSSKFQKIPGYDGPLPNAPYVESDEEIRAQMRLGSQQDAQKVLNDWKKRLEPYEIPTQNGRLQVTPRKGGTADFKFIPSDKTLDVTPDKVPMQRRVDPEGKPYWEVITPGGPKAFRSEEEARKASKGGKGMLGDYEEVTDEMKRLRRKNVADDALSQDAVKEATRLMDQGLEARKLHQTLVEMSSANEGGFLPRGPTAGFMLKVRQFLDNFNPSDKTLPGATDAELMDKFSGVLASRAVSAIAERGSNFQLETFLASNPNLRNTKEGNKMLLDVLIQEAKQAMDLRRIASKFKGDNILGLRDAVEDYYQKNPIVLKHGDKRTTTKVIKEESDLDDVPDGYYFMTPDGRFGRK